MPLLRLWEFHHRAQLAAYIPATPLISILYSCVRECFLPGARFFEKSVAPLLVRSFKIFLFILAIKPGQLWVVSTKINNQYQNKKNSAKTR